MAITKVGTPQAGAAINGGDVTLIPDVAPVEDDVLVLIGGNGDNNANSTVGPLTAGYTQLHLRHQNDGSNICGGVWAKRMGAVPDTQVVGQGTGSSQEATSYACIVLRGVDTTTLLDAAVIEVGPGTQGSDFPDPGAITTVTDGAWVIAGGVAGASEGASVAPSGYSNLIGAGAVETRRHGTSLATIEVATAGSEDPGFFQWNLDAAGWSWMFTVAIRPAGGGSGASISVGLASETESAETVTVTTTRTVTVGLASEVDNVEGAVAASEITVAVSVVVETETAEVVAPSSAGVAVVVGLASETESGQTVDVAALFSASVAMAAETEATFVVLSTRLPNINETLVFHLDASELAFADEADVTQWDDLSASGLVLVPGAHSPPTFKEASLNGLGGVAFMGNTDALADTTSVSIPAPQTMFFVAHTPPNDGTWRYFHPQGAGLLLVKNPSNLWVFGWHQSIFLSWTDATITDEDHMFSYVQAETGSLVRVDGTQVVTGNQAGPISPITTIRFGNVGASAGTTGTSFILHEFVMYEGILDSADIETIEAYLTSKWFTGGQSIPVGVVTETETAQAVTATTLISISVGLVSETDSAETVDPVTGGAPQSELVGLASELDTAETILVATVVSILVGVSVESDNAETVSPVAGGAPQSEPVGLASESELAEVVSSALTVSIPVAVSVESEEANPVGIALGVGVVSESDEAIVVSPVVAGAPQSQAVNIVIETELAGLVAGSTPQILAVGLASESETVEPIGITSTVSSPIGISTETEQVFAATVLAGALSIAVEFATESEQANPVTVAAVFLAAINLAVETELAQTITPIAATPLIPVNVAVETETAITVVADDGVVGVPGGLRSPRLRVRSPEFNTRGPSLTTRTIRPL